MRHHQTIVTSPYPSGLLILLLCPRGRAWYPRSHRYCRWTRPRASPYPERSPRADRASSHWGRMSMSDQKPDRLSKQGEAHRTYPKFTISCQSQCTGKAESVLGKIAIIRERYTNLFTATPVAGPRDPLASRGF